MYKIKYNIMILLLLSITIVLIIMYINVSKKSVNVISIKEEETKESSLESFLLSKSKFFLNGNEIPFEKEVLIADDEIYLPILDFLKLNNINNTFDKNNNKIEIDYYNKEIILDTNIKHKSFLKDEEVYISINEFCKKFSLDKKFEEELNIFSMKKNSYTRKTNEKIPVLLYHHILSEEENKNFNNNGAVISLEEFEEQMEYLHNNNFNTISTLELYDYLYNNEKLPPKSILITFDDGYFSNFTRAYTVLKKYNFRATLFLITEILDKKQHDFDPDKLIFVSKDSLDGYKDLFEYTSHTHSLHLLDDNEKTLFSSADENEIIKDLNLSYKYLNNNFAFAYPRGQYNSTIINGLEKAGIKLAFTVEEGYVDKTTNPFKINRFIIYPKTKLSEFEKIVNLKK